MKSMNVIVLALSSSFTLIEGPVVNAHESQSVRAEIRALQNQINQIDRQLAGLTPSQFEIVFRDLQRTVQLAPGATEVVALGCQNGEVVVTGGYNSNPQEIMQIVLNGPFFDGVHSGWRVDFHNPSDATVTVDLAVSVGCTKGVGRGE
jgi:hypothetical protein